MISSKQLSDLVSIWRKFRRYPAQVSVEAGDSRHLSHRSGLSARCLQFRVLGGLRSFISPSQYFHLQLPFETFPWIGKLQSGRHLLQICQKKIFVIRVTANLGSTMVYTGEPSKACLPCRQKRRKCDHAKPGCSQCARQKIECPGYETEWDLRLRDETTFLKQGTSRRKSGQAAKRSTPSPPKSEDQASGLSSPPKGLNNSTIDTAVSYFMVSYLDGTVYGTYLPQLYIEVVLQQPAEDALLPAVRAASLATLARRHQSQEILGMAIKEFSIALAQTNASLADQSKAPLNTTLGAVLTLGLFESIVSTGKHNVKNWIAHTLGTIALLRLRGVRQFRDLLGRRMCIHAAYNIRISCISRGVKVPQDLLGLEEEFYSALSFPNHVRDHYSIMNKTCAIKADMQNGVTAELICRALDTEKEAELCIDKPILAGVVQATQPGKSSPPQVNNIDIQATAGSSSLVLMARRLFGLSIVRLVLLEIIWLVSSTIPHHPEILRQLNQIEGRTFDNISTEDSQTRLKAYTIRRFIQISRAVLAFVPRFLDANNPTPHFTRVARCLVLPLGFIQSSPCCPSDVRTEVTDLLMRLERDVELSQAHYAVKVLFQSRLAGDWLP
ncbi:hypothetical protein F53441_666 [Fusarium austroafricanum]|uniref:Zn(2)-C6 fungal-type domain-containing protein n=1 Tax=Fusarium austroafricanum TaxID=2364996 RepID=A0A8H4KXX7_9HYPO|nr:hypothetical protein F53441_666 [Fusarium austroafricanum]